MKAWRLHKPGGPEALVLEELPRPEPEPGEVLIAIRAFGLNRSEWFTRNGDSPSVPLPRVLGIECAGEVVHAPGGEFAEGQKVFAMMGGMGRDFDGSYAEFTCVPASSVFAFESGLGWAVLGALPEMLQTCHGSLYTGMEARPGETILIRGGTSSIGLTTLAMAVANNIKVIATTRSDSKRELLEKAGAFHAVVDDGALEEAILRVAPGRVDRVLELVGTTTLLDSLQCTRGGGVVCMTGILGGKWHLENFLPMEHIPSGVKLTSYAGDASDISGEKLQEYVERVEAETLPVQLGPTWQFEQLVDAHRTMDANTANGKMVVLV